MILPFRGQSIVAVVILYMIILCMIHDDYITERSKLKTMIQVSIFIWDQMSYSIEIIVIF